MGIVLISYCARDISKILFLALFVCFQVSLPSLGRAQNKKLNPIEELDKLKLNGNFLLNPPRLNEYFPDGKQIAAKYGNISPINDIYCNSGKREFVACADALKAFVEAGRASSPRTLLPNSVLQDPIFRVAQIKADFTWWSVVEIQNNVTGKSMIDAFSEVKAQIAKLDNANLAIFEEFRKTQKPWSFRSLHKSLEPGVESQRIAFASVQALNAFLATLLDPHTEYFSAPIFDEQMKSIKQGEKFFGIGAVLYVSNNQVFIQSIVKNSPAARAQLYAGDEIVSINNSPLTNLSLEEVVGLVRGPENSVVNFVIRRQGQEIQKSILRGPISVQNVESELVALSKTGMNSSYIKLNSFMDKEACQSIFETLKTLEHSTSNGIIFDVRNNGGGLVQQAICLSSLFIGKAVVFIEESLPDKKRTAHRSPNPLPMETRPVVILQNAGSASASELMAGALQDHQRAWVLGERSFGKGSVQTVIPPREVMPGLMMKLTIARFLQPTGRTNQIVGITPDFEVPAKPNLTPEELFAFREGDIYPTALAAQGPAWVSPRPQQRKEMETCMQSIGSADQRYQMDLANGQKQQEPDYQLLKAMDLMDCMILK
ncbi:MAG: S41 family peptidase, partial [Bdellovibrio sp.]